MAGIRLLAQTTGIFTETAGGVTIAVEKLARAGAIDPAERVLAYITGDGLKTLDCVRGSLQTWQIEPTVESFERMSERVVVAA